MESRNEQLRRSGRRVFMASCFVAALVHAAVFAFAPDFQVDDSIVSRTEAPREGPSVSGWRFVDVTFGPPAILLPDGTISREPPDRVLEARYVDIGGIQVSRSCAGRRDEWSEPVSAQVRLTVTNTGRVSQAALLASTGEPCKDEIMRAIAGSVWYHWLPGDRFEAPVELIQPMTALGVEL